MSSVLLIIHGSIVSSDYLPVHSLGLTFSSGQSSDSMPTQCTDLIVQDDNILEGNETFTIRLTSLSDEVRISTGREQATVVIREDNVDSKFLYNIITNNVNKFHV